MTVATTVSPASVAGGLEAEREHGQDLVPVDHLAAGVNRQAPVRVAVVRDAGIGLPLDDGRPQHVQVGRAAAVVDVLAVGLGPDRDHVGARAPQQQWGHPGRGAVRAVDHHAQAPKRRPRRRAARAAGSEASRWVR